MNPKLVGVLMLGLLLTAASAVPTHEPSWEPQSDFSDETDFFYAGDDNEEASAALARSLRKAGDGNWEVSLNGNWIRFVEDGETWVLEPKPLIDKNDRIVLKQFFSGKDSRAADGHACLALVNKLNRSQNLLSFSVDGEGDLEVRYSFDYRNSFSVAQLKDVMRSFRGAVAIIFFQNQDEIEKWFE